MITVKRKIQFSREAHGRRRIKPKSENPAKPEPGSIPRISRLIALAIRLQFMLESGHVTDVTELAELSHVSQPRMSQILALNLLAPDIQEELLFLPKVTVGRPKIHEKMLRDLTKQFDWEVQRRRWKKKRAMSCPND